MTHDDAFFHVNHLNFFVGFNFRNAVGNYISDISVPLSSSFYQLRWLKIGYTYFPGFIKSVPSADWSMS